MENNKGTIVLIAFYNYKALGVRYLETALEKAGYRTVTVFFKNFNSLHPSPTTEKELNLICDLVKREKPILVGLSAMSSMYMDTVGAVIDRLKSDCGSVLVAGGAYVSMFPEHFLDKGVDFVIRSDGERALTQLADGLLEGRDFHGIPSLGYKDAARNVLNDIGELPRNIDEYGIPAIKCRNACYIENDVLSQGDPQLLTRSYEVIASRGCPFTCSYCCCVNLHRVMPKGTPAVRSRSVESVIEELKLAKKLLPKLDFVHFYDEIFPTTPGWVDQFVEAYKKEIKLPFTIWSHPKMVDVETLKKMKKAGLMEVIMGIQSGSDHIRKDVFHRYESSEDIIAATKAIRDAGVFWATYDFMLRHPFESLEDLKDTYKLVLRMKGPFELQLHGLNFLPGTDIVPMAVKEKLLSQEEMDAIMYAPMEKQFSAYWKQENDRETELWFRLTYCLQFKTLRKKAEIFANDPMANGEAIDGLFARGQKISKLLYYYKKGVIVAKSKIM